MGLRLTLARGPDETGTPVHWSFEQPRVAIGRAASCDVVIPDRRVSGLHATLRFSGSALVVVDESSRNGTAVNGKRLVAGRPRALRSGDRLRVGAVELEVETGLAVATPTSVDATAALARRLLREVAAIGWEPADLGGARAPRLRVLNGAGEGTVVTLPEPPGRLVVGRGEGCDVVLADGDASREHCALEVVEDGVHVVDLGSKNGVMVEGRLVQAHRLRDREEVVIGRTVCVFEDPADRDAAAVAAMAEDDVEPAPLVDAAPAPPPAETGGEGDDDDDLGPRRAAPAGGAGGLRVGPDLVVYGLAAVVLAMSALGLYALLG